MNNINFLNSIFPYVGDNIETALKFKSVCKDWRETIENYSVLMWDNIFKHNPFIIFRACSDGFYIVVERWIQYRRKNNRTINVRYSYRTSNSLKKCKGMGNKFYDNFVRDTYKCTDKDTLIYLTVFYNHSDISKLLVESGITLENRVIKLAPELILKKLKTKSFE